MAAVFLRHFTIYCNLILGKHWGIYSWMWYWRLISINDL